MGKIIFLNGCGSSGKTSIAKAIQQHGNELWISFGIDTFIEMIPSSRQDQYFKFIKGQNERGLTIRVKSESESEKLFGCMPQFAEMLADRGNNLIIDEVLFDEKALKSYAEHLKEYKVYYIGVFCDLAVMQEREVLRRDRCVGLSNDQIDRVHQGLLNSYDFKVDTSYISPEEAASLILKFVDDNPAPKAFLSLRNCG